MVVPQVGQVNADEHKELGGQYQVQVNSEPRLRERCPTSGAELARMRRYQGFPTIKFFGANKKKPVDYQVRSPSCLCPATLLPVPNA